MKEKNKVILLFSAVFISFLLAGMVILLFLFQKSENYDPASAVTQKNPLQTDGIGVQEEIESGQIEKVQPENGKSEVKQIPEPVKPEIQTNTQMSGGYPENYIGRIEETLDAFTNIIFNYDSREREYYEGTQPYMTQAGYQNFVPGDSGEEMSGADIRSTKLTLNQAMYYYRFLNQTEVEVIIVADITSSITNQNKSIQYLSVSLLKQTDGTWLIADCTVIDTIYT